MASQDFRKQIAGYGLTTAHILYRRPDHPWLLQSYVWQSYFFVRTSRNWGNFWSFGKSRWRVCWVSFDGCAFQVDQTGGTASGGRRVPLALSGRFAQA